MLAPLLMRNTPAAVACFLVNALAWGALAYRSHYEATEVRTLAVFGAACAAQTAARCALSLAPMSAPWGRVSGDFSQCLLQLFLPKWSLLARS